MKLPPPIFLQRFNCVCTPPSYFATQRGTFFQGTTLRRKSKLFIFYLGGRETPDLCRFWGFSLIKCVFHLIFHMSAAEFWHKRLYHMYSDVIFGRVLWIWLCSWRFFLSISVVSRSLARKIETLVASAAVTKVSIFLANDREKNNIRKKCQRSAQSTISAKKLSLSIYK